MESWATELLSTIAKIFENFHQLTEERDAHMQAIAELDELVTRMALTATSEDFARDLQQSIDEYRKKAHELVCIHTHKMTERFIRSRVT